MVQSLNPFDPQTAALLTEEAVAVGRCFSGHAPVASSLSGLVGSGPVKRAEVSPDGQTAEIYLQEVTLKPCPTQT